MPPASPLPSTQILTDAQRCPLVPAFLNARGNPAPVDTSERVPQWTCSAPDVITLTVADDGMSAMATPTGTLGSCQVSVTADADMSDGVREITGTLEIVVRASEAVSVGIRAGTPEDIPV